MPLGEASIALMGQIVDQPGEGFQPGRWWQVLDPDGKIWCETSGEQEAREAARPGDTLLRQYVCTEDQWVRYDTSADG